MKRLTEDAETPRVKRVREYDGQRIAAQRTAEFYTRLHSIHDRANAPLSYERLILPWLLFDASGVLLTELRAAIRQLWVQTARRQITWQLRRPQLLLPPEKFTVNLYEPVLWLLHRQRHYWTHARLETDDGTVVKKALPWPSLDPVRLAVALDEEGRAVRCSLFDLGLDPLSLTLFL